MVRQNDMQGHIVLSVLVGLLLVVSPALARQQEGQQPAPDPQKRSTKEGKEDKDKPGGTVGKSKLEKETGTINDRIFEVLPNYGTVENTKNLPPLTAGQKFRLATAGVFDWGAYPFNVILAGIAQAKNDPKEWGQGWDAYGKRYGFEFICLRYTGGLYGPSPAALKATREIAIQQMIRAAVKGEITLLIAKSEEGEARVETGALARPSVRQRMEQIMAAEKIDEKAALKKVAKERGVSKSEAYREMQRGG